MRLFNKIKSVIRTWLNITPARENIYYLNETFNLEFDTIKNRIQIRGDPEELDRLYKQLERNNSYFWAASPRIKIRKIHSGLPSLMMQVLANIVIRDLNDVEVKARQMDWDNISKDNNFNEVLHEAIKEVLFIGDGAFKILFGKRLTQYPIIEFVPGDKVKIVYKRDRFAECVFKTEYRHAHKRYVHYEHYGKGYIKNVLTEWGMNNPLPLSTIPQTINTIDVAFAGYRLPDEKGEDEVCGRFTMTVPFKIEDSIKWENRGESIFDKKASSSDGLDEIISQWVDAVRAVRTEQYILETLIPRDPGTRRVLQFNQYDNGFLMTEDNMKEKDESQTNVTQPIIPSGNYLRSYISLLNFCLQGVISPSILGIDIERMDNVERREKKEKPRCI